ncbi:septal ring lytic transglycosylase RlpA family protein [Paenimyroides ceti]|uniref:septal ring lytic transglycosylase RlpA family protein n=1 Tax=Paenimyroides ceti TaxID=395087 RepID=UPI00294FF2DC|nr:septal ring lytic transglycosylase RlpA family protein [Paenimyroides ceti]
MKRKHLFSLSALLVVLSGFAVYSTSDFSTPKSSKELAMNVVNYDSTFKLEKKELMNDDLNALNNQLLQLEDEVEVIEESAVTSYYHDKFNGKKTASGEVFNNKELTAAHKTLPFGTKVRVTNLSNEESVIVTVNDRGPHSKGRSLDLSKSAFMDIAHHRGKGTLNVKIEVLPDDYEENKAKIEEDLSDIVQIHNDLDLNEFAL